MVFTAYGSLLLKKSSLHSQNFDKSKFNLALAVNISIHMTINKRYSDILCEVLLQNKLKDDRFS